jgi:glycosyltransferase involved in cell wall biosynthesis
VRILHVITTLDVGGAEMHLLAQVGGQVAAGHTVSVAYLKGEGRLRPDFLAAGALRVDALGSGPATPARLIARMRGVELVHSHLLKADMLCALCAPLAGRPLVASKHNDEQVLRRGAVGRVHGVLGAVARRTIVLSDHVGRFIAEHGRVPLSRQTRIYYGLNPAPFQAAAADPKVRTALRAELGVADDEVLFICVARFAPQKAHDVLLKAFAAARANGARARLLLVGDDPFGDGRVRAERLAQQLRLGGAVTFAGIRRDVPQLLAASDVYVMPSLWEGLGLVFLEAMATGRPVLATTVSAIPEVVVPDVTGILVPPADPVALASAMERLASDAGLRLRLAEAGRKRVLERFGLERMVAETLEVYRSVLGDRSAAPKTEARKAR